MFACCWAGEKTRALAAAGRLLTGDNALSSVRLRLVRSSGLSDIGNTVSVATGSKLLGGAEMTNPSPRRMLAVAFGPPTMAEAIAGLPRIRQQADCVEMRLDLFQEQVDVAALLAACGDLTVVATLRPLTQGGKSHLP